MKRLVTNKEQKHIKILDLLFEENSIDAIVQKDLELEGLFPLNRELAFYYANEFYQQALLNNNLYYQAEMARCLSRFYILSGNMVYAHKFLMEAYEIAKNIMGVNVENRLKPSLYAVLGYFFFHQKEHAQARKYTLEGIEHIKKIGAKNTFLGGIYMSMYINLSESALIHKDLEEAKIMLAKTEDLLSQHDYPAAAYLCTFVHKAKYLQEVELDEEAKITLEKAEALKNEVGLQYRVLLTIQWTNYYIKQEDQTKAKHFFDEAREQLSALNMLNELAELYQNWSAFLEQIGNYKTALEITKQYISTIQKLKDEKNMKAALAAKYQESIKKEQEAQTQLKREIELKENFFLNITHDLRNTLFLILNPLEQVKKQNFQGVEKVNQAIDTAIENSKSLLVLSNRLFEANRIVEDEVKIEEQVINWIEIIYNCWKQHKEKAKSKGIVYQFHSNVLEFIAPIDPLHFQRIINNLLGNAIKFTPENEKVSLQIEYSAKEKNIYITIEDTGIGISKKNQAKIFEKFYQVNTSNLLGGTGLGLTIVKRLCNSIQFIIELESEVATGTLFRLQKKIEPNSIKHQTIEDKVGIQDYPKAKLIPKPEKDLKTQLLIIDDNIAVQDYLATILCDEGYTINVSSSAAKAHKTLESYEPDLILVDYLMPEENGLDFATTLKNNINTSHIPIILMTAGMSQKEQKEVELLSLEQGIDSFLIKPVSNQRILLEINKLLNYNKKLKQKSKNTFADMLGIKVEALNIKSKDEAFLEEVLSTIDQNLNNQNLSPEYLESHLYMHQKTIYRKLRNLLNISINELIRKRRLYKASLLLKTQQDSNLRNVALDVGFSSLSYFTKCFKREFGMPPSKFLEN